MRRRYLVSYDVSDDKRRTGVFRTLMGNGDHVQFSVFLCELNDRELAELKGRLGQTVNQRQDQVIILDLGAAEHDLKEVLQCLGKAYEPPSRILVV
ncbi:MAG: CRISPR-associated endonuclease Cas2 [Planctomycetota bacterium]|nr:CRISPR-associated endonuclease Cas2 [Planctomycetota bacterium]